MKKEDKKPKLKKEDKKPKKEDKKPKEPKPKEPKPKEPKLKKPKPKRLVSAAEELARRDAMLTKPDEIDKRIAAVSDLNRVTIGRLTGTKAMKDKGRMRAEVWFTESDMETIRHAAQKEGVTVAHFIREAAYATATGYTKAFGVPDEE